MQRPQTFRGVLARDGVQTDDPSVGEPRTNRPQPNSPPTGPGRRAAGRAAARPAFAPEPLEPRVFLTAVTSFTLINADTDQPVAGYASLVGGATLDLSKLPTRRLNVRANVDATTKSVRFGYDANASYRVESWAPFALAADEGGNYNAWTPTVGTHTIKATPFADAGAAGTAGATRAVTFTVVSSGGAATPVSPPASPPASPPVSPPPPATPYSAPSAPGFRPLFNGQNLSGFRTYINGSGVNNDPQKYFRVENGMLRVLGMGQTNRSMPFGYLATNSSYSNYRLRFEYKWGATKFIPRGASTTPRDSGLLLHAVGADRVWPTGFEVQIQEGDTGDTWLLDPGRSVTASTTVENAGAATKRYREGGAAHTQTGGRIVKSRSVDSLTNWNTIDVIVEGGSVITMVNGVVLNRATNLRGPDGRPLTAGRIGFQAEGAEIWYRNIQIKPLAQAAAPAGAVRLFDGSSSTAAWTRRSGGGSIAWGAANGELTVRPGTGDVRTRQTFRDFRLHLEFNTNVKHASVTEQDRGNSGVGLGGSYELQVLDSYGRGLSGANDVGAIYGIRDAARNAALPAGAWQSYDVTFTAARWNGNTKIANARATVYLDGQLIHNNVEIPKSTFTFLPESPAGGPIVLQEHGNAVRFRNIWAVRM